MNKETKTPVNRDLFNVYFLQLLNLILEFEIK